MYKVFAGNALIYDSTLEDLKIGKGEITLELDKSGSFVFSLYPEHPQYNSIAKLKTIITVYRSGRIVFRGRVLDEVTDVWNVKTFTCEGELSFLQDSIVRPYSFAGAPESFFRQLIELHNAQADAEKQFRVGTVTVVDANGYIARENPSYETTLSNLTSRLLEDVTGGHFYITHGDDGADPVPTIHYLANFTKVASQPIEFGVNLQDYTKTVKAEDIATAIIPLGAAVDDGDTETEDPKLTISGVNDGVDYVYSPEGVAQYGWIFKVMEWEDVTDADTLKAKATAALKDALGQTITLELSAVDMHLLDRSIESYNVCEYVPVISRPHNFDNLLLCNKQTLNLLKPESDTVVLGETFRTYTGMNRNVSAMAQSVRSMQSMASRTSAQVATLNQEVTVLNQSISSLANKILYNGLAGYVLAMFTLDTVTFSSGEAKINAGPYLPEGHVLLNCIAQATTFTGNVITSTTNVENAVTVRARKLSDGAAYSGTTSGPIHFIGVCQPQVVTAEE